MAGVAAGAFGAHALKERLDAYALGVWNTAVQYQMYHAFGLLVVGILNYLVTPARAIRIAGWCFSIGILIFSGSLYILSLTGIKWLGAITPIGGVLFLAGWLALALSAWKADRTPSS